MRINKYLASASGLSRRKADSAIAAGRVTINGQPPQPGQDVTDNDVVTLDGRAITPAVKTTIMLNKPAGYVVSREGQGSQTIYDLLPPEYKLLNPVGRLDKNSSGLLLLTNDGNLANELTHPSHQKVKVYEVTLYKPLTPEDLKRLQQGIELEDGLSKFQISKLEDRNSEFAKTASPRIPNSKFRITMHEGRNRQIRRTFAALNYEVKTLHRTHFGDYQLGNLEPGLCTSIA